MTAAFHAAAADRIASTEARLGRKIWAASELPDGLSRALWWKQRRWYFDDLRNGLGEDDLRVYEADDEFYEAQSKHALLIREMWARRFADREDRAWAALPAKIDARIAALSEETV